MNEVLMEQIVVYGLVFVICGITIFFYLRKKEPEVFRDGGKS